MKFVRQKPRKKWRKDLAQREIRRYRCQWKLSTQRDSLSWLKLVYTCQWSWFMIILDNDSTSIWVRGRERLLRISCIPFLIQINAKQKCDEQKALLLIILRAFFPADSFECCDAQEMKFRFLRAIAEVDNKKLKKTRFFHENVHVQFLVAQRSERILINKHKIQPAGLSVQKTCFSYFVVNESIESAWVHYALPIRIRIVEALQLCCSWVLIKTYLTLSCWKPATEVFRVRGARLGRGKNVQRRKWKIMCKFSN